MPLSRVRALFRTRSPPFQVPECYDCHAGDRGSPGAGLAAGAGPGRARPVRAGPVRAGAGPGRRARRLRFDIAAQPLDAALAAYAQTTGMAVLVASRVTAGRRAAAVQGWYAPQDALSRLLAGTGLQARYSSATAFTLVEPAARPSGPDGDRPATVPLAYAGVLQRTVTRALCQWRGAEFGRYRAALQLWIGRNGVVGAPRRSRARATRGATRR